MTRLEENTMCINLAIKGIEEGGLQMNDYTGFMLADISKSLAIIADSLETRPEMKAIDEVKSKMISFHTDAIFQYGADIIEARADAFDKLKDWLKEQK